MNVLNKYGLLFLLMILTCFSAYSQQFTKWEFSISAGAAIPLGSFAKSDTFDQSSTFASTGQLVSVLFSKPLNNKTCLNITLQAQRNPVDRDKLSHVLAEMKIYSLIWIGPGPLPPLPYKTYADWKVEKSSWVNAAAKIGVSHEVKKAKNFNISVNGFIGTCFLSAPEINASSNTDTSSATIFRSDESAFGFIYSTGVSAKHNFNNMFFLTNISYLRSVEIRLKDVRTVIKNTGGTPGSPDFFVQQSTQTTDVKKMINSLNISLGIGFFL